MKTIILYGHKLNSNLKGIYDYSTSSKYDQINVYYLTMDPAYYRELKACGVNALLATKLSTALFLANTRCIVSDHGLHLLIILLKFSNIKFVDVWHGIPFKGFDPDDFRIQHKFDEVWVTSTLLKKLYTDKFGFDPKIVHTTGYARTDILVKKNIRIDTIKQSIGISDIDKRVVIFAPTWQQDENNRNIFPFNTNEELFFGAIDELCAKLSVVCVFRAHLNTASLINMEYKNILFVPHNNFPDTESILLTGDLLVCDWSSIAFDYLLLNRPTIFLDVPPPFKKGLSLNEKYRFGDIVSDFPSLLSTLECYIKNPHIYLQKYCDESHTIKQALYDDNADGYAGKRCFERLKAL
ncbi:MAG: CDP-glycerol--glycerophosphate glycerophosphotransferase [Planctomycetes bacterium]|nr:CDP-glycerol--glycerophosphate glycerophosphotransferase [Planctomycetota bacterium]